MKAVFEQTPRTDWESFHCEVVQGDSYHAAWHFHPEYQLTLVIRGYGHRLVGDNITPLYAGDLVMLGSNLPHVWQQEQTNSPTFLPPVHAIIIRFLDTFAGKGFLEIPEMRLVRSLLRRAGRGLHVTGKTQEIVAGRIQCLPEKNGLERVCGLLSILNDLAVSKELKPIASRGFLPELDSSDQDRMQRVCDHINRHLSGPIQRAQVAKVANLSEAAFSRFFKLRAGKTLPRFINELRVGRACRLLVEEEMKIVDIALNCGFSNLTNFNRRFLEIAGYPPSDYRRQFQRVKI
jgi:AraC-like DNA-binding protein